MNFPISSLKTLLSSYRYLALSFALMCVSNNVISQKTSGDFYIFKKNGDPASDVKDAAFLLHVLKQNDTTYISRYYSYAGPMIRQETFRNADLTIPDGRFCWYNNKGELDSTGTVTNGRKNGKWLYIKSRYETVSTEYDMGVKTKENVLHYDENGKYISAGSNAGTELIDPTQKAAEFRRGAKDWVSYCEKNLKTPDRLQNILPAGTHTCVVDFLVDKQGNTSDIYVSKSCEWSADAEVIRLVTESPKWTPAVQLGKPVYYRQRQSLSFAVLER